MIVLNILGICISIQAKINILFSISTRWCRPLTGCWTRSPSRCTATAWTGTRQTTSPSLTTCTCASWATTARSPAPTAAPSTTPSPSRRWRGDRKWIRFIVITNIFDAIKYNWTMKVIKYGVVKLHYKAICRLRMVKNTNFFWDSKKIFLTYRKTVFWVTKHFCIKWTFWKNVIFFLKNAFFWQKWPFDPRRSAP